MRVLLFRYSFVIRNSSFVIAPNVNKLLPVRDCFFPTVVFVNELLHGIITRTICTIYQGRLH